MKLLISYWTFAFPEYISKQQREITDCIDENVHVYIRYSSPSIQVALSENKIVLKKME